MERRIVGPTGGLSSGTNRERVIQVAETTVRTARQRTRAAKAAEAAETPETPAVAPTPETPEPLTPAQAKAESDALERRTLDALVEAWSAAVDKVTQSEDIVKAAERVRDLAKTYRAVVAFKVASHPLVRTADWEANETKAGRVPGPVNYSGAAEVLEKDRSSLRPYIDAGLALANAGRPLTADIAQEDVDIVLKSFKEGANQKRKDARAAKAIEDAAKAKEAADAKAAKEEAETNALAPKDQFTAETVIESALKLRKMIGTFQTAGGTFTPEESTRLSGILADVSAAIA
jgi:hypothetical protein